MILQRFWKSSLAALEGQKAPSGARMHPTVRVKSPKRRFLVSKVVCAHLQNCAFYIGGEHNFTSTQENNDIDSRKNWKCSGKQLKTVKIEKC